MRFGGGGGGLGLVLQIVYFALKMDKRLLSILHVQLCFCNN